ncbi:MAG: dTDP-glucose 4,6-dehydratase [Elusimicrobia bacterium RBG_16_66_12]|nr:MAG: dTDP-glucose 4,6-dehydratase [Elusimicrobia bacterium RBG_16_66_12]
MKVLVTGGLGFIGSNFIRRALKARPSWAIVNLDKRTYAGNPANLADIKSRYQWIKADICDPKAVERAMKGCELVVHFAAETHVDRSILDAGAFLKTNILGTQVLLDAALRHKVRRFLHVSTDEVYGSVTRGYSKETDRLEPNSPYAASKAASDMLVRSYFVTHKAPVVTTRASNNYGPYQYPEKALPLMITNFMEGKPFPQYGDGRQVRDWLHVVDHARAILLVLEKGGLGETYNIGGSYTCQNRELIAEVLKLMGKDVSLVTRVEDRKGHDRRYALDCSKLKRLGFRHAYDFEKGLRETISWYQANERWWRPLKVAGGYRAYYGKQYRGR